MNDHYHYAYSRVPNNRTSTLIYFGKIFQVVRPYQVQYVNSFGENFQGGSIIIIRHQKNVPPGLRKRGKRRKKRKKEKKRPKGEKWISSLGPRSRSRHLVIYFPCLLTLSQYNACARITSTVATLSLSNSITSSDHKKFTQLLILLTTSRSIHLSYRGRKIKKHENRSRFRQIYQQSTLQAYCYQYYQKKKKITTYQQISQRDITNNKRLSRQFVFYFSQFTVKKVWQKEVIVCSLLSCNREGSVFQCPAD